MFGHQGALEIDLTTRKIRQQDQLKELMDAVWADSNGETVFRQGQVYTLPSGNKVKFKQTVIFYQSVKDPGRFRAAVVNFEGAELGSGAFGEVYPVLGTLYHDGKAFVLKKKSDQKARVIKRMVPKSRAKVSEFKHTISAEANIAHDKEEDARLHGKEAIFTHEYHDGSTIIDDAETDKASEGYLIMRRFPGKTLSAFIKQDLAELSLVERSKIAVNLLDALQQQVFAKGLIHRDIKPGNIMINPDDFSIQIIDFGIATREPQPVPAGTMAYYAPEVYRSMVTQEPLQDQQSDYYAMGMVIAQVFGAALHNERKDVIALAEIYSGQFDKGSIDPNRPVEIVRLPQALQECVLMMLQIEKQHRAPLEQMQQLFMEFSVRPDVGELQEEWLQLRDQVLVAPEHQHIVADNQIKTWPEMQRWVAAIAEVRTTLLEQGDLQSLQLRVLTGIQDYLKVNSTLAFFGKRKRATSPRRIKDVKDILRIAVSNHSEDEKRRLIDVKLKAIKTGGLGRSKLRDAIQKAINPEAGHKYRR